MFFRDLLARSGVAVFPGILTFVLAQDLVRFTTARSFTTSLAACRPWPGSQP